MIMYLNNIQIKASNKFNHSIFQKRQSNNHILLSEQYLRDYLDEKPPCDAGERHSLFQNYSNKT